MSSELALRHVIPQGDIRMKLPAPARAIRCPYQGAASYWSALAGATLLR